MIKRVTWIEIGEIHVYNTFWCSWFKCVFGLENYEIWRCALNNFFSFLGGKKHGYKNDIWSMCHQIFIYLAHSYSLGMKNARFGIVYQQMNATCQM